jgi:hypothetical protein
VIAAVKAHLAQEGPALPPSCCRVSYGGHANCVHGVYRICMRPRSEGAYLSLQRKQQFPLSAHEGTRVYLATRAINRIRRGQRAPAMVPVRFLRGWWPRLRPLTGIPAQCDPQLYRA